MRGIADAVSVRRDDLAEDVAMELRRNPDFCAAVNEKFLRPRLAVLGRVIDRAVERGEIGHRLDPTVAIAFVSGPVHHRVFVLGEPVTPAFLRAATTGALAALGALAAAD